MHHLSKEAVETIMEKIKDLVETNEYPPDKMEEIFNLSGVNAEKFLECKANPLQEDKVNFELDDKKGIRFFDPFNLFTCGIYKDVDGLTVWTADNLSEPWSY